MPLGYFLLTCFWFLLGESQRFARTEQGAERKCGFIRHFLGCFLQQIIKNAIFTSIKKSVNTLNNLVKKYPSIWGGGRPVSGLMNHAFVLRIFCQADHILSSETLSLLGCYMPQSHFAPSSDDTIVVVRSSKDVFHLKVLTSSRIR